MSIKFSMFIFPVEEGNSVGGWKRDGHASLSFRDLTLSFEISDLVSANKRVSLVS